MHVHATQDMLATRILAIAKTLAHYSCMYALFKFIFYLLTLASNNVADTLKKQRTSSTDFSYSNIHRQSRNTGHADYTYNLFTLVTYINNIFVRKNWMFMFIPYIFVFKNAHKRIDYVVQYDGTFAQ